MSSKPRVAVGLSGGVDSSVTALLLKRRGYEVIGITMQVYNEDIAIQEGAKHACFGPGEKEEIELCERLAKQLDIPYRVIDLRAEYKARVLDYFREEYLAGRTPNPCVRCNSTLKFGFLTERAREAGIEFDYFATGHYARKGERHGRTCLMRAADLSKDQSYFLFRLSAAQLDGVLFPLGDMLKAEVKQIAREAGLEAALARESQDFISGGDVSPLFAKDKIAGGDIMNEKGEVLGHHRGLVYYTVGQRRGVGIGGGDPLYVKRIDAEKNRIIVSDDASLFSSGLHAVDVVLQDPSERDFDAAARIRQNHKPASCRVTADDKGEIDVSFLEPQRGVAPGQSIVLYDGNYVLGGGTIDHEL
jgi:tRNA-specific 2-thiouridylase